MRVRRQILLSAVAMSVALALEPAAMAGQSQAVPGRTRDGFHPVSSPGDPKTNGRTQWASRFKSGGFGQAVAIGLSPDGARVFAAGIGGSSFSRDYAIVAIDAGTGTKLWNASYNGPGNDDDQLRGLAVSGDGAEVFVTGFSRDTELHYNFATVAYDTATGAEIWVSRYAGPINSQASSIASSPDGSTVFVTGYRGGDDSAWLTIAYDATSGRTLWVRHLESGRGYADYATALAVSPDGSQVFVTGVVGGSYDDWATVAYDTDTGVRNWVRRYNGPGFGFDQPRWVMVSPDSSRVFVSGWSFDGSVDDYATAAYDAGSGSRLWLRRYNRAGHGHAFPNGLALSADGGRLFVTGPFTVAYDTATGERSWARKSPFSSTMGIATSPVGSQVFVTGGSPADSSSDLATISMDQSTGGKLWSKRYDASNDQDWGVAATVSQDGSRLFVTGNSIGEGGHVAIATVAYSI